VFAWRDGVTLPVPGLEYAGAINASGAIAGASGGHVALWQKGRVRDLGVLATAI
jgi:hypothetical protein